jgi:hypothetical protein
MQVSRGKTMPTVALYPEGFDLKLGAVAQVAARSSSTRTRTTGGGTCLRVVCGRPLGIQDPRGEF